MLTKSQNELITRVEGDAPMGLLLKQHQWVIAARAGRLEAGGAPLRVRLFGENFVAFRVHDGRVGFIDEACPHRSASMALARNEDCALTCIFHGWKVDVTGKVISAPTQTQEHDAFIAKIKTRQIPVIERGGLIWVYLGEGQPPVFPEFEFLDLAEDQRDIRSQIIECNWVQGLEATIDAAHVGLLHQSYLSRVDPITELAQQIAPVYEVDPQHYGFSASAIRYLPDGRTYVRGNHFATPWYGFSGVSDGTKRLLFVAIPVDDVTTHQWFIYYDFGKPIVMSEAVRDAPDRDNFAPLPGGVETLWGQDREAMKKGHFTGFTANPLQEDMVVQVSMGPIVDRSKETLSQSDAAIVAARGLLLKAVRTYQSGGNPFAEQRPEAFGKIRSNATMSEPDADWRADRAAFAA